MRREGGVITISGPNGLQHVSTFTCKHCQRIVAVKPFCDPADLGGQCPHGCGLICPACVGKGCDPFEEKLARAEARRSYEQVA